MVTTDAGRVDDYEISRRAWQTLLITSVSMMLVAMDVTIVSVALPGITKSFSSTSTATLSWVFTSYNVTFAALLLLAGKLGDRCRRAVGRTAHRGTRAPSERRRSHLSRLARPVAFRVPGIASLDGHRRVGW